MLFTRTESEMFFFLLNVKLKCSGVVVDWGDLIVKAVFRKIRCQSGTFGNSFIHKGHCKSDNSFEEVA